ncbi:formate dehydrogenase subunit beta [Bartonella tamiae]|uniref:Formate dehydrogenase, beta subunit n=1 Tax=Bartonella tamiae Th239 TaxID=1094558 RepID=J0ZSG9_9HYPH|nr:formate dehydrogenase subunit beta [Bartonella tamiae]EJF91713.1 formate dehydrogenase, beta subunit [Bartonella tamiae Th239]EJF92620.1 formate dehydrogenase, beta subunit [Bartonella tamiae Th307]
MNININPPTQDVIVQQFGPDDYIRSSASTVPEPKRQLEPVAKLIDVSRCIGCKACQSACSEWNDLSPEIETNVGVYDNPHDLTPEAFTIMRFSEWVNPETDTFEWLIRKDGCMHCAEPGCLTACPSPGAIVQYSNGIVDFDHDKCIGCGYCVKGCPFNIPRISKKDHKAYKCTLCSDRIAVGQIPACAKSCPTEAIMFGAKADLKEHAKDRIADLNNRGYENAGLYDPEGVGGTHVMYVLHHADQPNIYSNLPEEPRISPIVKTWKGVSKYLGLGAIGAAIAGAAAHALFMGPTRVKQHDENEAEKALEDSDHEK